MRCQNCNKPGAVGRNIMPVPDGKFQGKDRYKYWCKDCINGVHKTGASINNEQPEKVDEEDYPF